MKEIQLTRGMVALVDDEDHERVAQFKWQALQGSGSDCWYAVHSRRPEKGGNIPMHRLIMNAPVGAMVDHINGNGLDNQRANLRLASNRQNQHNTTRAWGRSGIRGVVWDSNPALKSHWFSSIRVEGSRINLGHFMTKEEAAAAYRAASLQYHGEFSPYLERV